jgi:hypothetical protein
MIPYYEMKSESRHEMKFSAVVGMIRMTLMPAAGNSTSLIQRSLSSLQKVCSRYDTMLKPALGPRADIMMMSCRIGVIIQQLET